MLSGPNKTKLYNADYILSQNLIWDGKDDESFITLISKEKHALFEREIPHLHLQPRILEY